MVTVTPVNDSPNQGSEEVTVPEDGTLVNVNIISNNIDVDGDALTVTFPNGTTGTGGGTFVNNNDGTVDYTPLADFNGTDTLFYTVCDNGTPIECVNDTLIVTVSPVNDSPSTGNETLSGISEDEINPTTSTDLTVNNIDPDGTSTKVTDILSSTGGGITNITNNGTTIDYTPAVGFSGVDTIVYKVCDEGTPTVSCVNDTLFVTVTANVTTVPNTVKIPEGFTPDGDGINDNFVIQGIDQYPNAEMIIFNRWGNKVYESTGGYNNDWNGTSNFGLRIGGDKLPIGTYFYVLELGDGSKAVKGFVYLNK